MRLIAWCLLFPSVSFAQQTLDAEQFFALGIANYQEVDDPVSEEVRFPWIDRYEFRTESSDFDLNQQEYLVRLSPSTAKIRNAQKAFYDELRNAPDFERQEKYCDLRESLHLDWLSLFVLNEKQGLLDELVVILNDKQTLYERMAGTYEFEPKKLVELQTEKTDLEIAINKLNLEREFLLRKYSIQDRELDFGAFTTVEAISTYLANNLFSLNEPAMIDVVLEHKKQLLVKEIELEESEGKRLLDFVQVKYDGPHSDALQERISVGLGFQISNSGNQKLKLQELQIEQEELKRKSERNLQEQQTKLSTLEYQLQSDIQAFLFFQKTMQEERTQLQSLSTTIAQQEGTSPLLLLEIEERYLSMEMKSLNKKGDLLEDYLKYLRQSDAMCQPAFINYLAQ